MAPATNDDPRAFCVKKGRLTKTSILAITVKRLLVGLAVLTLSRVSTAQSADDKTRAETLFEAAKKAMGEGRYDVACPSFADSLRLDPGIGTALFLGDCYRKLGKIASAAKAFQTAFDMAQAQGDKRASVAKRSLDALHPSKVTIVVDPVPGLELACDGAPAERTFVIDGGTHTIVASVPGQGKSEVKFEVPQADGDVKVTLPKLGRSGENVEATPDAKPTHVTETRSNAEETSSGSGSGSGSGLRIAGLTIGGVGVGGIVAGAILGVTASSKWNDSNDPAIGGCDPKTTRCMNQKGVDLRSDANTLGTGATIAFVVGGILTGVGITLVVLSFTGKKETRTSLQLGPTGASLAGVF
jgi:serine/threonine-protein kinase